MCDEFNWAAFTAIFQALGVMVTFSAVMVALWQTKYNNRKRVKLSFTYISNIVSNNILIPLATLTVSNIGNRPVVISNWGFMLDRKNMAMVIPDPNDRMLNAVNMTLPCKCNPEESVQLAIYAKYFRRNIIKYIEEGFYSYDSKIKIFCTDSVGKRHYVKMNHSVRQVLDYFKEKEMTE